MRLKANYFVIPLIVAAVAVAGSFLTSSGMQWYDSELIKPALTPPRIVFPIAWNLIFIMSTISALIFYNKAAKMQKNILMTLFAANAILNVAWSLIFFVYHMAVFAFVEMLVLEATIVTIIVFGWRVSKTASLLLVPYMLWLVLASYLTFIIAFG
jgi:tryptophan-rich sensory protein